MCGTADLRPLPRIFAKGSKRASLFSALDWTPTLLAFAGLLSGIEERGRTWGGLNQYRTIMYGDAHNERDSLVLNVGLPSLESASVVFRYPKQSNNLYKYIAEDSSIDVWRYNHVDGWCAKDLFSIVLADDVPLAQSVDNKYPTVPW